MLYTELDFWVLFGAVLAVLALNSFVIRSNLVQSTALLIASYTFYGYWDIRFLSLIMLVSGQTYLAGMMILRNPHAPSARLWLMGSVAVNLAVLFTFKYFNFFLDVLENSVGLFGGDQAISTLNIVLPVGISFYIFQTLTFVLDIRSGQIRTLPSALHYFTYVAFFPQLVAGPIERARNLLPQFEGITKISWDGLQSGARMIIFGLFLKVVIADQLAPTTDEIYTNYNAMDGGTLLLGMIYFGAQIYCDFCGYSTIAIGVARCLGFDLMMNFRTPFFATSVGTFWRRWHISLSSFFRDYVYIPLGGSRGGFASFAVILMTTFLLSGLWHGAAWGYIAWGGLHGAYIVFERAVQNGYNLGRLDVVFGRVPTLLKSLSGWFWAQTCILITWPVFRLENPSDAWDYLSRFVSDFGVPESNRMAVFLVLMVLMVDTLWRKDTKLEGAPVLRYAWLEDVLLAGMLALVLSKLIYALSSQPFIYFQF